MIKFIVANICKINDERTEAKCLRRTEGILRVGVNKV
jgi:hypothetical protein